MKKHIIFLPLALVLFWSCSDILNTYPKSQISDGNMWATPAQSKAGIDGLMYPLLRRSGSLSTITASDGTSGINRIQVEGMGYTSILDDSNPFLKKATKNADGRENSSEWRSMYATIHACNKAIARLRKDVVGEKMYNQYICEARMIRAFCYSRLAMFFGEAPIYLDEIENSECTRTQDPWDDVWTMVIDECTKCIGNEYFQLNTFGERLYKPSKGMAYAVRGNAYMWLAANKNPEIYPGAAGISEDQIRQYYTLAAADFAKVKECGFGLWDGVWEDFFSYKNEHSKEMIFPLEFTFTTNFSSFWQWVIGTRSHLNAWTRLVPSQEFVDDFEWEDGTKFSWEQVFPNWRTLKDKEREVFFLRDSLDSFVDSVNAGCDKEKYITLVGQREKVISRIGQEVYDANYLNLGNEARLRTAYDTRDPRLDKLVVTPYKKYKFINEDSVKAIDFQLRWPRFKRQDAEPDSDLFPEFASNMVYVWNKYIVNDGSSLDRELDGTDWPLIRYTEIQLLWAEALLETGDIPGAVELINEVRTSGGMPALTSTDYEYVRDELRYETRVAVCQEGKDFYNEIRWGTFKEKKFQGQDFWDPRSCWGQGGWKTGYYYTEGMWPLSAPLGEIVMNSNLKKRPGWSY